jgi:hypothetical protein
VRIERSCTIGMDPSLPPSNVGSEHFRKLTNPLGFLSGAAGVALVQADIKR